MPQVKDNPATSRFEMRSGDSAAFVAYRRAGDQIAPLHTELPKALSGKGVGSKLVRGTLDVLRGEGMKVVPCCEFVAANIGRHPEYRDLLADEERAASSGWATEGIDGDYPPKLSGSGISLLAFKAPEGSVACNHGAVARCSLGTVSPRM